VADCRQHIHEGIAALFSNEAGSLCGRHETRADETVVALLKDYPGDISLVDIRMTEESAVETIKRLLTENPEGHTLILAAVSPRGEVVPALHEGAAECVLNAVPGERMAELIHAVHAGKRPRDHSLRSPKRFK
jgi:DNA-binding NarL/FixJ family response regulator